MEGTMKALGKPPGEWVHAHVNVSQSEIVCEIPDQIICKKCEKIKSVCSPGR